ncbi:hypothetical protein [Blastococcus tunisiensis]|uniref:hypothetical protein n=1 Tax=Blastococcus tunisiensis TaxID=1798228 RepID=UPI0020C87D49|nr:hypothetical protein [Blastococcus sp. DSM 46838]
MAKSTGLGREQVAKAAAVVLYADTAAALIAAAGEGPGRFHHALTRAKQARQEAEGAAALLAELTAAGRTVLDEDSGRVRNRLADLEQKPVLPMT